MTVPAPRPVPRSYVVEASVLPSGLRVVTAETSDNAAAVGLFVGAGHRQEAAGAAGAAQVAGRALLAGQDLRAAGIFPQQVVAAELSVWLCDSLRSNVPAMVAALGRALGEPPRAEAVAAELAGLELEQAWLRPQPSLWLPTDALARTAFAGGLGSQLIDALPSPEAVAAFRAAHYVGPAAVLAAVGPSHAEVRALAEAHLALPARAPPPVAPARYVGGQAVYTEPAEQQLPPGVAPPTREVGHGVVAWPAAAITGPQPDLVVFHALRILLGGAYGFSTGGPGKGMHSHLNQHTIRFNPWLESIEAQYTAHSDCGLFAIYFTGGANSLGHGPYCAIQALVECYHRLSREPVVSARAINMLRSSVLTSLEQRAVMLEDLGRHALCGQLDWSPDELANKINAVTVEQMQAAVFAFNLKIRSMLQKPPTIVYYTKEEYQKDLPPHEYYANLCRQVTTATTAQAKL